ncbi:MAG: dihydroorotase, partial [Treponema sp.]|nr:dihydroorotase [Treponema sp.]
MTEVLVIFNARLVDRCIDSPGAIVVVGGKIRTVFLGNCCDQASAAKLVGALVSDLGENLLPSYFDARGRTLMPAFIDMHVHFRYPGQTQKEDLDSGLHAAIAGGFGTVVLMPNTSPVISTRHQALKVEKEAAKRKLCRVFQTQSITKGFGGEDTSELDALSPIETPVITEDGHDVNSAAVMFDAMKKAGKNGIIVSCHCEDVQLAQAAKPYRERALDFMKKYGIPADRWTYQPKEIPSSVEYEIDGCFTAANHLLELAENVATDRNIALANEAGCHIHIAHCSTEYALEAVRRAKHQIKKGRTNAEFNISVEVTPHHLSLAGTEAPMLRALVNPPLRSEDDRRAVIEAIKDGTVDVISTDHAPHTPEDKAAGSPGFTGLETSFAVCHTVLCKKEDIPLTKLSELMSARPAELLGLDAGSFTVGYAADFVLVDTEEIWMVDSGSFYSKGHATP